MKAATHTVTAVPYAHPVRLRVDATRGRTVTLDFSVSDARALRDALTVAVRAAEATESRT